MWLDHPWLGVGPDNFLYAYRSVYALPAAWEELQLSHPHNLFLDLLTRVGLLRLPGRDSGSLACHPLAGFKRSLRPALRVPRPLAPSPRPDYLGLFVGLAAGLAHGLIDNSIFLPDLAILTLLVVGVTARMRSNTGETMETSGQACDSSTRRLKSELCGLAA